MADGSFWDALENDSYLGMNDLTGNNFSDLDLDLHGPQVDTSQIAAAIEQIGSEPPAQFPQNENRLFNASEALDDDLFEGEVHLDDNEEFCERNGMISDQVSEPNTTSDTQADDQMVIENYSDNHSIPPASSTLAPVPSTPTPLIQASNSIDLTQDDDEPAVPNASRSTGVHPNQDFFKRSLSRIPNAQNHFEAALVEYNAAFSRERARHIHMIGCWILAQAAKERHITKTELATDAQSIWTHMITKRIEQLREAFPTVSFNNIDQTKNPRLWLLDSLKPIIEFQNPGPQQQGASEQERVCWSANVKIETLKWEADMMADLTTYFNSEKIKMIRKTGVKEKMMDGHLLDLVAMISYPIIE